MIKVIPVRSQCHYPLPIFSTGGILLRETYCLLPAGHDGPHRNEGAILHNVEGFARLLEQGKV
jgi:hypothetical protein